MTDNKKNPAPYVIMNILGTGIATSAFLVYANGVKGFPVGASFFWFMLFSTMTMFVLPGSWKDWIKSLKKGDHHLLAWYAIYFFCYFFFVLTNLKNDQPGVVVTIMVINLLRPAISSLLGFWILDDKCKNWYAFVLGVIICAGGIILYKFDLSSGLDVVFFDQVFLFACFMLAFQIAEKIVAAKYRRNNNISAVEAGRSMNLMVLTPAFLWMMVEANGFEELPWPNLEQALALLYLGAIPTAIGSVMINRAVDVIGVMVSDVISDMRPVWVVLIGFIPFTWFNTGIDHYSWQQITGILVAAVGVVIVIVFAKGEAGSSQKKKTS